MLPTNIVAVKFRGAYAKEEDSILLSDTSFSTLPKYDVKAILGNRAPKADVVKLSRDETKWRAARAAKAGELIIGS